SAALAAYAATGLFDSASLRAARAAPAAPDPAAASANACREEWRAETAALPKAMALLSEAMEAERRFRQEREPHAYKD
ncbi:MAG: hypothetical protein WC881_00105, partial [Elusimicrobiota bacterium]